MSFMRRVLIIGIAVMMVSGIVIGVLYLNRDRFAAEEPEVDLLAGEAIPEEWLESGTAEGTAEIETVEIAAESRIPETTAASETAEFAAESKAGETVAKSETAESAEPAGSVAESKNAETAGSKPGDGEPVTKSETAESTAESKAGETAVKSENAESTAESKAGETATKSENAETTESKAGETATKSENAETAESTAESRGADAKTENLPEDKQAPVFLAFTSTPQIKVGKEFDVHKYCGYADDVDRHVEMEVTGTVDTSKEGTYEIKIKLTDDAGHVTSNTMKVKVMSSVPSSSGQGKKEDFADFVKNYKTDETSVGIDISRWQETVDFEKIKAAGCEFVYMRLGGYDNGELYTDRFYLQNMAGAKAAGLKVGIYWHSEESSRAEMKESIDYMMKVLDGQTLDFPIAFDWEDFMNFEDHGMNLYDINDLLDGFAEEIEARGYRACLYGSKNKLETLWTNGKHLPIWLAHYVGSTNYGGDYFMWQHSCTGRIDGINGDVDLDVLYNSKTNW